MQCVGLPGQAPVHLGQAADEMRWMGENLQIACAKHVGEIRSGLYVHGQGIGVDALLPSLADGLPHVCNAIASLVAIVVCGFAVADEQQ